MLKDVLVTISVILAWSALMVLVLSVLALHSLWIPIGLVFCVQALFAGFLPDIVEKLGYEYGTS